MFFPRAIYWTRQWKIQHLYIIMYKYIYIFYVYIYTMYTFVSMMFLWNPHPKTRILPRNSDFPIQHAGVGWRAKPRPGFHHVEDLVLHIVHWGNVGTWNIWEVDRDITGISWGYNWIFFAWKWEKILTWLVVNLPLWKMMEFVKWECDSQYIEKK